MLARFFAAVSILSSVIVTASDDIAALNDLLANSSSITAQFEQVTVDASGSRVQESTGRLVVQRPDRFRWQVATPFPQLVISDGNSVSIYDPDLEQLTVQPLDPRAGATPALILSGDIDAIARDFDVKEIRREGAFIAFQLIPRSVDSLFESLELSFVEDHINSMKLFDSLGSNTRIDFSSVQLNQPIEPEVFVMKVPEGTDIIEDSK